MIRETGTVVELEPDAVWVETLQKTTCGSCAARIGCGQKLVHAMTGRRNRIRVTVPANYPQPLTIGSEITLGIPEHALVIGSVLVYLLPMLGLLAGAAVGHYLFHSEVAAILAAIAGVLFGGLLVRWHAWRNRNNSRYAPVLIADELQPVQFVR